MKPFAVCVSVYVCVTITAEPLSENQAPKIICYPQKKEVAQTAENLANHFALSFRFGHRIPVAQTNRILTRTPYPTLIPNAPNCKAI